MLFLFCLWMSAPMGVSQSRQPAVEVYLPPVTRDSMNVIFLRMEQVASEIYSQIGIRVVWRSAASHPSGCGQQPWGRKIVVALAAKAPGTVSNEAFAYSNPYATEGPCVTLLMGRLESVSVKTPISAGSLLGHALAHEMGHVLQGMSRHSEAGLMKASWSLQEIASMGKQRLQFTRYDKELIMDSLLSQEPASGNR